MNNRSTPSDTIMTQRVMNLGRLLADTARRLPDKPALIWRGESWSWDELNKRVDQLASALQRRGISAGSSVLVQARNSNQMFESMWACFKLGAVWVPCNFRLTPPEVAFIAASSGAKAMIADDVFSAHCEAVREAENDVELFITIGSGGALNYEDLLAESASSTPFEEVEVEYQTPCWLFYTSGTTGRPKGAVLTHGQLAFVTNNHLADLMPGLNWAADASLVMAPLSHGAGVHILAQVARGVKSVLTDGTRFDEEECWRLVAEHRISNAFTVPLILTRLVRHTSVDHYDHSSLKHLIYAGAPMYREDQKVALQKLGKVIVQYYGLGEVTGNIAILPREEHSLDDAKMRIGSCGFPRTGMEIAIKDPDGKRLGDGLEGEICIRGPAVFAGYHENPEANAKALKDGWFHTGDLGHLDDAGYLYITGRASDMYISGGSNVYPREAEELLLTHPRVAEVAVLGVPDPDWGESGVAVIVPEDHPVPDAEDLELELQAFLENRLARYKHPKRIFFREALPASGYGKIPKHLVRQELYDSGTLIEGEAPPPLIRERAS